MGVDILGIDIMGVEILRIDILALPPVPDVPGSSRQRHSAFHRAFLCILDISTVTLPHCQTAVQLPLVYRTKALQRRSSFLVKTGQFPLLHGRF